MKDSYKEAMKLKLHIERKSSALHFRPLAG
jgi:hypothetical protein